MGGGVQISRTKEAVPIEVPCGGPERPVGLSRQRVTIKGEDTGSVVDEKLVGRALVDDHDINIRVAVEVAGHGRPAPLISHDRIADGRTGGGDEASKAIVEEKTVRFFVVGHVDIQAVSTRPGVRKGKVAQRSLLHLL